MAKPIFKDPKSIILDTARVFAITKKDNLEERIFTEFYKLEGIENVIKTLDDKIYFLQNGKRVVAVNEGYLEEAIHTLYSLGKIGRAEVDVILHYAAVTKEPTIYYKEDEPVIIIAKDTAMAIAPVFEMNKEG